MYKRQKEEAAEFYKVHQTKPFYDKLCSYLSSGPIVVMILQGKEAISKNRQLMGATDPLKADKGTLRKMYGISIDKNSVHGQNFYQLKFHTSFSKFLCQLLMGL